MFCFDALIKENVKWNMQQSVAAKSGLTFLGKEMKTSMELHYCEALEKALRKCLQTNRKDMLETCLSYASGIF